MRKASKVGYSAGRVVRRLVFIIAATAMSVAGLVLLAGGGYMLLADQGVGETPASLSEVLAQDATSPAATALASESDSDYGRSSGAATVVAAATSAPTATATATATSLPTVTPTVKPPTATATRIVRSPATATPIATADADSSKLPDTGFGDFLQPIAGFGLAGIALVTHVIRRRR